MPRTASDTSGALPGRAAPQLADAKFKKSPGACGPFMLTRPLIAHLRKHFSLDWQGIHGAPHWARVRANGLRLAETTGAHQAVVELFAFLHDSCRLDEYEDPGHGERAAGLAHELRDRYFELPDAEFSWLVAACKGHSDGLTDAAHVTILTCWDADRLDLGRIGIRPKPTKLCTSAARDPGVIEWAYQRSRRGGRY